MTGRSSIPFTVQGAGDTVKRLVREQRLLFDTILIGLAGARVPLVKLLASAITIGSGGVAGREGPMALITGGVGSWYATITGRPLSAPKPTRAGT